MTKANMAAFKAKVAALIDTLHLSRDEVQTLALGIAAAHAGTLSRLQMHGMLDAALLECRGFADARDAAIARMAAIARSAKQDGIDGAAAIQSAFPSAPPEISYAVWWEVEQESAGDWWDNIGATIEGVAK